MKSVEQIKEKESKVNNENRYQKKLANPVCLDSSDGGDILHTWLSEFMGVSRMCMVLFNNWWSIGGIIGKS